MGSTSPQCDDGTRQTFQRLEMPKLPLDAAGQPRLLSLAVFAAAGGESYIVNLALVMPTTPDPPTTP